MSHEADVRGSPPSGRQWRRCAISAEPSGLLGPGGQRPGSAALRIQRAAVGEYKEYASYYMATKIDGIKSSVRNIGIYAGLGIAGLMAFSALISTAVALFLIGAAMGVAHLFDPPKYWLGALIVGLAVLVLIGVGAGIGLAKANAGFRKATVDKYEQRKRWQRGQFGRDVEQAAAAKKEK